MFVWTAYELSESPHTHQPGLSAMAAQVFWGSASWAHEIVAVAVFGGDLVSSDEVLPATAPACIPPMIPSRAVESEGDSPAAVPPNRPPSPAMMAAEIEAGKAALPVGKSIRLSGHDPSRFLYPPGPPQS